MDKSDLILKEEKSMTTVFAALCKKIEDFEAKGLQAATEFSDYPENNGVWNEEERAFLDRTALKNLYKDEHWVYVICDLIAQKIARQSLKVYQKTIQDGEEVIEPAPQHPYNKILKDPNEFQSYNEWMYCVCVDLVLVGEAIVWGGIDWRALYQLPIESVVLNVDLASGKIVSYDKYANHDDVAIKRFMRQYPAAEICQIKKPNPSSLYYGFSPFIPARKPILFNRMSLEYLNNFYLKGAVGGVYLELAQDTNISNVQRLLRSYENAYAGRKSQRRTKILPPGVKANAIGETLAEQQLEAHLKMNKQDILATLKVPPHEVGLQTSGSLGSEEYKTALKNFYETTIIPYMGFITSKLNKSLKESLGDGYFIDFDLEDVEVLKDNAMQTADLALKLLKTHTLNEVRQKLYQEAPLEGGDETPTDKPAAAPFGFSTEPMAEKEIEEKPLVIAPKPEIVTFAHQAEALFKASGDWIDRRDANIEDATKDPYDSALKMFIDMFAAQGIEIVKRLPRVTKAVDLKDDERIKKEIARAVAEINKSYKKGYSENYKENLEKMAATSFDHPYYANDQKIVDKIAKDSKKELVSFLDKRSDYLFKQISQTSSDQIYKILKNSAMESDTITEMSRKISEYFADPQKISWRAERIARTETLTVLSQAQNIAAKKAAEYFPDLKKMWISAKDVRTRGNPSGLYADSKADHWGLHGQIRKNNDLFIDPRNGDRMAFPRDPRAKPESVINCRCTTIVLPQKEMDKFQSTEEGAKPNA